MAEAEEAKAAKLKEGVQVVEMTISSIGDQALQKAKKIASTTTETGKWTTLIAKAQRDKGVAKKKWATIKFQLDFL